MGNDEISNGTRRTLKKREKEFRKWYEDACMHYRDAKW